METSVRQASRIDATTGIREIAEFFSPDPVKVFGFTHLPASRPNACVVVCSPLYAEFIKNYRREVLIGRRLAALGIAVQRFHYRGQGNSEGDGADTTFDTMRNDALAAAHRVVEETGVHRLAFFGSRFGALVAAAAAARYDEAPLVLWDPILEPSQYLRDVFRAGRIRALKEGDGGSGQTGGMLERLVRDDSVQVLGYTITRALYESAVGRTLENELGTSPRRALVVRLGKDPRLDPALSELVTRWRAARFAVEDRMVGRREAWWFTSGGTVRMEALADASELTVNWLARASTDESIRHG